VVVLGRLINPALAGLEAHIEIRHALRRLDDAFDAIIFASDDPCWAGIMEIGSVEILAFGFGEFEGGWHRHPQLKTLDPLLAVHSAGVPDAAACAHPLDTAGLDYTFAVGGLLVERLPGQNERQGRYPGMGMEAEFRARRRIGFEVMEKHERLDQFADIARTDQAGDGPVRVSTRSQNNRSGRL